MMPFKAFFILLALLCSLIIQPSMATRATRDLAHDTQTKVDGQKPADAGHISRGALAPSRQPCVVGKGKPYGRCLPSPPVVYPRPCRGIYRCRPPPPVPPPPPVHRLPCKRIYGCRGRPPTP